MFNTNIMDSGMLSYRPAAEVSGALTLYMDFINLFINLLQLFGDRK